MSSGGGNAGGSAPPPGGIKATPPASGGVPVPEGGISATNQAYINQIDQSKDITASSQGMSLGAALLNLSIEEARPQLGGGLSLFARLDRRIGRLESDVAALKQTS